jgi:hypothetical protein
MNPYRPYTNERHNDYAQRTYYRAAQRSNIPVWNEVVDLARQRPGIVIAGALLGGFLLARYLSNKDQPAHYRGEEYSYRPMWSHAPRQAQTDERHYQQQPSRPVDHMGATEDQMSDRFADPSRPALEEGAAGTTGSAYELDPNSITAG